MSKLKDKEWWSCAGVRAIKTTCQCLSSTVPVGLAITPAMIHNMSWSYLEVVLAWLLTGCLAGLLSLITSLAGLPEMEARE